MYTVNISFLIHFFFLALNIISYALFCILHTPYNFLFSYIIFHLANIVDFTIIPLLFRPFSSFILLYIVCVCVCVCVMDYGLFPYNNISGISKNSGDIYMAVNLYYHISLQNY